MRSPAGSVVKPDDVLAVPGFGMPERGNPYSHGRLFVHFTVEFPDASWLDEDRRMALASLLPAGDRAGPAEEDEMPEEVELHPVDTSSFGKRGGGSSAAYDSDDDARGGGRGGQQVRCAQQ